jgi:predicted nucleic acid-binding protein
MALRLVVDTNILFASLIRDSTTRRIILTSPIHFIVPTETFNELNALIPELSLKNSLTVAENLELISILSEYLEVIDVKIYLDKLDEAYKLIGQIDEDDVPFLALALAIECDGIWTEDKHFEKQQKVRIWKIKDVIEWLRNKGTNQI